jgi:hypothetical protein
MMDSSYSYNITLIPYEGKQFRDAHEFGRALALLADKLQHDKIEISRYNNINDIGHGRILDTKLRDTDIPAFAWVVSTNK